ncbi:MAG TPA: glycosyltransferase family 39 protein [Thermoanaerobaculia bacterium]|nr:glycosyltransferase family 39 protein [Thermoanaerobaculia bacterium]
MADEAFVTPRRAWIGIAVIVALSVGRVAATHHVFAQTSDEPIHLVAGYDILRHHSWTTDMHHPPLARVFFALPFVNAAEPAGPNYGVRGNRLLENGRYTSNVAHMRLGNLLFLALGIIFVGRWAMHLFSPEAGLLSAALFAMLPPILAHGGLATTDMAVAAMMPFALDELTRLAEQPAWRRAGMTAIAIAAGVLSKYSFVAFFPAAAAVLLAVLWFRDRRIASDDRERFLICGFVALIIAAAIVWAGFGFDIQPLIRGLAEVRNHNATGHRNFLFGQMSWDGWWYYFPVALFFKTPIPFLLLALTGCALLARRRPEVPLIAAAILGVSMTSGINIGVRHVLPIYAPLAIAAAAAILALPRLRIASAALVLWLFVSGVIAHPDYLPWFNVFAPHPEMVLNDSNLDWGQDVLRLVRYTRREHIPSISLFIFTSADLDALGFPPYTVIKKFDDIHGWFSTSEMQIALAETHSPRMKNWLDAKIAGKPYTRIGKTIRLYHLD